MVYWSLVPTGCMVTGYLVTGYWLLVTGSIVSHWFQVTGDLVTYWLPSLFRMRFRFHVLPKYPYADLSTCTNDFVANAPSGQYPRAELGLFNLILRYNLVEHKWLRERRHAGA